MSDVYRIGVIIDMSGRGLGVLGAMSAAMTRLTGHTEALTGRMNALRLAAVGAMGVIAGVGTLHVMGRLVNHGAELVHQQNLLRRAGVDNQRIAEATATAWRVTQQVPGTQVAANLRMFGELRSQMSSDDQALQFLPDLARMGMLMQNETGRAPDRMAQTVMRVLEQRGQIFGADGHTMDPNKVRAEMAQMYQAMSASHGLITPQTFLGFMQQAGPAGMAMSPQSFYGVMPTAMQTMGGHRSGTAMASLFSQMVGGVMTQRTATEMQRLGLLDPNMTHVRRGGQVTIDPGGLRGFDPANPFAYFAGANSPFQSAVAAHGGQAGAALEGMLDPKIVQELYRSLGRETTRRIVAEFIALAPTFERDQRLRQQTMTPEAAAAETATDPAMAMTRFTGAWSNLQTALGGPLVETAVKMLDHFTGVLNRMAAWATANPQMVEYIGLTVGALGVLATIGGGLAIAAAALTVLTGPVGLTVVAAGLVTLAAAIGGDKLLAAVNSLSKLAQDLFERLAPTVIGWIRGAATEITSAVQTMFASVVAGVVTGLQSVGKAIVDWVKSLIPSLPSPIAPQTPSADAEAHRRANPEGGFFGPRRDERYNLEGDRLPIQRQNFVPPARGEQPININVEGKIDRQTLLTIVASGLTRSGSSGGMTGYDFRASPPSATAAA